MLRLESWIIKIARPMTHTLSDIIMWVSQLHSHSSFPVVELYQELNRLTWLRCAKPSSQSLLTWRFLNDSLLPPAIYLQPGDGSLVFIGSSHTVGRYHCVSVEQGLGKTVAIFSVKQGVTPHGIGSTSGQRYITSQSGTPTETGVSVTPGLSPSTSHTTSHSSTCQGYVITTQIENLALNSSKAQITDDGNPLKPVKSYHGELVAVSVLLAACVLTLGGLYLWHQRSLRRVQLGLGPEKTLSLGTVDP